MTDIRTVDFFLKKVRAYCDEHHCGEVQLGQLATGTTRADVFRNMRRDEPVGTLKTIDQVENFMKRHPKGPPKRF